MEVEVCRSDTCVSCQRKISTGGANNTDNDSVLSRPSLWEADTCRPPPLHTHIHTGPWRIPLLILWHLENVVYEQGNLSGLWGQGADPRTVNRRLVGGLSVLQQLCVRLRQTKKKTKTDWQLDFLKNLFKLMRDGFDQPQVFTKDQPVGFGTETLSVRTDHRWDRPADLQFEVGNLSSSLTSRMKTSNVI